MPSFYSSQDLAAATARSCRIRPSVKQSGVVCDVLGDEGRHEVVGVVVACLHSESHRDLSLQSGGNESQRLELVHISDQEAIIVPLVTQDVQVWSCVGFDELSCVVLLPR